MKVLGLLAIASLAISSTADAAGTFVQPKQGTPIPGKYIVKLKGNVAATNALESKINEISGRLRGYPLSRRGTLKVPKITERFEDLNELIIEDGEDNLQELLNLDDVDYIEQDVTFQVIPDPQSRPSAANGALPPYVPVSTEANGAGANVPNWGLLRITQRDRVPEECVSKQCGQYVYPEQAGEGITAYVIDTGVQIEHAEFEGRARHGKNFVAGSPNEDENGHGTHVASLLGGGNVGVAKKAEIVGLKVINPRGETKTSDIVAAMNWARHDSRGKRAVVNMSLGGPVSRAIDDAVDALVMANIPVFAAAGNYNMTNSCTLSPARAPNSFTVAASNIKDQPAIFTSFGECVDIIAPGDEIWAAAVNASNPYRIDGGTSMASPLVAGVAAVYMSIDQNLRTPQQVYDKLKTTATRDAISGPLRGTPNLLLYLS
ncbi:hypothetical protein BGZ73_002786 [Actinomortierella ambigua]|nr:hypothetical protein BGZ73_002786 [Actinomortierella ambigua]